MPLAPDGDARAADWSINTRNNTTPPTGDRKLFQASLRMDYEISESLTMTSLTTYNRLSQNPVTDLDGSSAEFADNPQDIGKMKTFNQELRLSNFNEAGTKLSWLIGANYDKMDVAEDQWITYADNSLSSAPNLFINVSGIDSTADIENYAFFGNAEYDVTDKMTLRAGARYTKSKNLTEICGYSPGDGRVATLFTIIGEIFTGIRVPLTQEDCYTLNDDFLPGTPFVYDLTEDNVSWKTGLDYHVNDDTLVYLNVSRGYKTGSFPAITAALQSALIPATQESVTSYELGAKATLMDGAMQVNAALFYQDYKDKQIQGTLNDPAFGLLQQLQNVPKSRISGAEIDLMYVPTQGLTISASASYIDTKVTEFEGGDFLGFQQDFAGDKLPFAPKWTFVLDADYRIPVGNAGNEVFFGATLNHRTEADAYIGASRIPLPPRTDIRTLSTHPFVIDGYTLVDLRFGYDMPEKGIRVTAWAKNVFNEFYATNLVSNNDVIMRLTGQPVSYGITVGFQF
jgi:outer membrane receptor protein involved in Fe transport